MIPDAHTFTFDGHELQLLSMSLHEDEAPPAPRPPVLRLPSRITFTSTVNCTGAYEKLAALLPSPAAPLTVELKGRRRLRPPYQASSWTSRRGRRLYGCRELGLRFWTAFPSQLSRRRIQSRLDAFSRLHPPPLVPYTLTLEEATMKPKRSKRAAAGMAFVVDGVVRSTPARP